MSENLIGRMFVGPNGARYTFEGFENMGNGHQLAKLRDLAGNLRRLFYATRQINGARLFGTFCSNVIGQYFEPLVPAEATELTVSRDVEDPDLWVLTWWVGDEGFDAALMSIPEQLHNSWVDALAVAKRLTGRPWSDFEVVRRSLSGEGCLKEIRRLGTKREEVIVYAA